MANKIGIVLALDGEKEFSQGLKTATSAAKEAQSQLKALDSQYSGSANSMEALRAKQEALTNAQEKYQAKLSAAQSGEQHAQTNLDKTKQAYDELKDKVNDAQRALEQMNSAGLSGTSAYADQEAKVNQLNEALSKQGIECGKAQQKVYDYQTKVNGAQTELNNMNKEVEENGKYLEEAESSADGCATSIDEYGNKVQQTATDVNQFSSETQEAETVTTSWADKLKQAFANAAVTAGMQVLRKGLQELKQAFKEMVEVGSEFESSMSYVSAVSGATGSDLDALTAKAKELGSSTKFTASEVSDAFGYMSLAGWDTEQMLDGISGVLDLAAASGMELADASDMVTDYLSAFNMEASDATTVADMLAFAQANSNTTVEQLGEAYGNCAASLNAAGQDIETVTALLEAMANQGEKGSTAGTALNAVMRDISNNMEDGAIKIGDTTVAVADQEGNFRDLTDIIADVEAATDGLGTAETRTALSSTFTSRSMSAMNLILNEGSEAISEYEDALRSADGAAADMADTMQDNLEGDMTKLNSALEGLGIAIFDYFDGPLRSAAQIATTALSGITDAITPEENAIDSMIRSSQEAITSLQGVQESTHEMMDEAQTSADELVASGENLIRLNDIEDKTVTQQETMKGIVDDLSGSIPQLSQAFNEETGQVELTDKAIRQLIESQKDLMLNNAMQTALQDETQAIADATLEYTKAQMELEKLQEKADFWNSDYWTTEATQDIEGALDIMHQARDDGVITQEEFDALNVAIVDAAAGSTDALTKVLIGYSSTVNTELSEQQTVVDEAGQLVDDLTEEVDQYTEALERNVSSQEKEEQVAEERANREMKLNQIEQEGTNIATHNREERDNFTATLNKETGEVTTLANAEDDLATVEETLLDSEQEYVDVNGNTISTLEDLEDATISAADADKELVDAEGNSIGTMGDYAAAIEEATESLEDMRATEEEVNAALSSAYNDTFDGVISAYQSAKDELAQGIDIDFRTEFNGGADETVESMLATAQENTQALQNYEQNLQEVSSHLGNEIAPEFMQYLMDLGTDGANTLEHISKTFEQDNGSELVKQWSDEFLAQMEIEDQISEEFAALKMTLDGGLEDLGSTDVEWEGLQESLQTAVDLVGGIGDDLTQESYDAFQEAAQAAQEAGVQIPDGLAEGLEEGKYSVETATDLLNESMQGKFDALVQIAEENGIEVSDSLSEGVEQGGAAAAESINTLVDTMNSELEGSSGEIQAAADSAITEGMDGAGDGAESSMEESGKAAADAFASGFESGAGAISDAVNTALGAGDDADTSQFSEAGTAAAEAYASGMTEGSGEAEGSGTELSNAATGALEGLVSQFSTEGQSSATNYASGITGGAAGATTAASGMASLAAGGAGSQYSSFFSAGSNMSSGVASGISSGASAAITAATNMAVSALNAAKSALDIASPSKKFRKDVGQQISSGMAFGIKDKASLAGDEATAMSNKVYNNATAWLKKYKKSHDVSQADEKYYWQQVSKHCETGSTAYCNAIAKMIKADTSRKDSNGKKKDTETYYADIFSSASQYLDNLETLESWSLKEEQNYWKSVQKQLKKGTQAWYDAQKEINSIQSKIGTVSNMNSLLSAYETYFELSEKAEMQYWDTVRKQYEYGTDERLEADQKYYDAKKKYTEKLEDLEDEYYEKVQDVNDKLKEDIQSLTDEYDSALQSRTEAIAGAFGLFDEFTSQSLTGQELLENLQGQAAGYEAWVDAIDALENRGILSEDLMTELTEMGPDQLAAIYALMDLTDEDLTAYQEAYDRKMDAAIAQAEKDTSDLKADLEKQTAELNAQAEKDLAELKATYDADVASVNTTISSELNSLAKKATTIAEDQTTALVTAINGSAGSTSANKSGNVAILSTEIGEGTPSPLASAPGYASGGRVNQTLAWMDEQLARLGPEMVVSRKDNALLTRLPADSEIIDAGTTDNLLKLGQVDVGALMKTISAQQSAITHYLATASTGTGLNNVTIGTTQPVISTKAMESQMGDMYDLMSECIDLLKDGQYIYLDSGKLIGATAEDMGIALAKRANRAR